MLNHHMLDQIFDEEIKTCSNELR